MDEVIVDGNGGGPAAMDKILVDDSGCLVLMVDVAGEDKPVPFHVTPGHPLYWHECLLDPCDLTFHLGDTGWLVKGVSDMDVDRLYDWVRRYGQGSVVVTQPQSPAPSAGYAGYGGGAINYPSKGE